MRSGRRGPPLSRPAGYQSDVGQLYDCYYYYYYLIIFHFSTDFIAFSELFRISVVYDIIIRIKTLSCDHEERLSVKQKSFNTYV